ncbi:Nucleic-acid-binding protein from transposon X-element [Eumeta japonica]|uniref:Nucleic-acid-binding protein from transposon X-element n=1 Tax=Eumeta variegata TaxID=151549 RepID=A0A4C1XZ81_EUMVA|nr:Nucleic-acid-binding protein from transposon X-element [Eumeta japonica]
MNYTKAVRVAEDKIKITVPDVETFRSLNKYLIDNKVQFHTYALDDVRKLKVVIRGVPEDINLDDIKSDLINQVCGLFDIRVEAPHKRGVSSQCHRCQRYGHASVNCHVQPRCVKCLVPHWTSECPLSKDSGDKPACANSGQEHTANYGGCPKAHKVVPKPTNRINKKLFNNKTSPPVKDTSNFPALSAKNSSKTIDDRPRTYAFFEPVGKETTP